MTPRLILIFLALLCLSSPSSAQEDSFKHLPLEDMSQFETQAGNWQIVGDVYMDRRADLHPPEQESEQSGKKKKKKKRRVAMEPLKPVYFQPGTGILLNQNDDQRRDALLTKWEHGDIDLSLEVMLPKGSNSGIYLQGRYEVQLFDSWGVRSPKFSDIGGVYRNWESEPGQIYMGKAPLSNPSKAPGLWQKLDIAFRAPKFDETGKKISNARLAYVDLNGIRIHENVEIPLPTGGPIDKKEASKGPLMIQGDHGPVAFRNIKYRILNESKVSLGAISYHLFHQAIARVDELDEDKVVEEGTQPKLSCAITQIPDQFVVRYQGQIEIPEDDSYQFTLAYTGGAVLRINDQVVINEQRPDGWWRSDQASMTLQKGTYPINLTYYKNAEWMPPRLALSVKGASTYSKDLHDFGSYPPDQNPVSSIPVDAAAEVRLLRAFLDFKGDANRRLTHTIAVGEPQGTNYVYNLKSGAIAAVWRGAFIDATPMWHNRGDGSFKPRGATIYLKEESPVVGGTKADFKPLGYTLDTETGRPSFHYQSGDVKVSDQIYPNADGQGLVHNVTFEGQTAGTSYLIAEAEHIRQMPDGSYAIDDHNYYIKVNSGSVTLTAGTNGQQLKSNSQESLSYTIIW